MPKPTCLIFDCENKVNSRGMCSSHYIRWRNELPHDHPLAPARCSFEGCKRAVASWGLCHAHYRQTLRGQELRPITDVNKTPLDRFNEKITKTAYCWTWNGKKTKDGYGTFSVNGKRVYVHVWSYDHYVGDRPRGHEVDHRCHNTSCVNPEHLRAVTRKQNGEHLNGANSDSKTGVRGVWWSNWHQLYIAGVTHHGKSIYVGAYKSIEEADRAVRAKRAELFTHDDSDY